MSWDAAVGGGQTFGDGHNTYDVEALWELTQDLSIEEVSTNSFGWMLDDPVWSLSDEPDLTPRMVLDHPGDHPEHTRRIAEADLSYPILLTEREYPDEKGTHHIADGMHRLARATRDGAPTVRVQRIPPDILAKAVVDGGAEEKESEANWACFYRSLRSRMPAVSVVGCLVYCAVNWDDPPQWWPDCFKNEWQTETKI